MVSKLERPNTVSGLMAKREELIRLRSNIEKELRGLTCDIDHLEAAIVLFDPEQTPEARKRYATKHRAQKGTVKRFVLNHLRTANGRITAMQLADWWISDRGLKTDDSTTTLIRKRFGACLTALARQGIIEGEEIIDGIKKWQLVRAT